MSIACPKCGSRNLRFSRSRNATERAWKLLGVRAMRCRDCHTRFVERTWKLSDLAYARCPRCWRMDLNRWSEKHFQAPNYMLLALKLGGNPYRCEYCRFNFVSFRRRKEKFSFHRWEKLQAQAIGQTAKAPPAESLPAGPPPAPAMPPPAPEPAVSAQPFALSAVSPPRLVENAPASAAEAIAWRKAALERRRG